MSEIKLILAKQNWRDSRYFQYDLIKQSEISRPISIPQICKEDHSRFQMRSQDTFFKSEQIEMFYVYTKFVRTKKLSCITQLIYFTALAKEKTG